MLLLLLLLLLLVLVVLVLHLLHLLHLLIVLLLLLHLLLLLLLLRGLNLRIWVRRKPRSGGRRSIVRSLLNTGRDIGRVVSSGGKVRRVGMSVC